MPGVEMSKHSLMARFKPQIFYLNDWLGHFREPIWIVGDGRSGTTWLAELLMMVQTPRFMFEPFHPIYLEQMKPFYPYYYARPTMPQPALASLAQAIFTGRFTHPLVDRSALDQSDGRFWYKGLVIKDVFANLLMKWAVDHFPTMKTIWLLRHPFAVALSKAKTSQRGWPWPSEPVELLAQADLVQDYLQPFATLIQHADSYFTKQVTLWAILNYVPLQQLRAGAVLPIFYETLCLQPLAELKRIWTYLHPPQAAGKVQQRPVGGAAGPNHADTTAWARFASAVQARLNQPSYTSRQDGKEGQYQQWIGAWQQQLPQTEINAGLAILQAFGLDQVYQDHAFPLQLAEELLSHESA